MGVTGHHFFSRSVVLFSALCVLVFACVDISECNHRAFCFILNVAIILCSIFGLVGAWRMDGKMLSWFMLLIVGMICFECGFIIWAFVANYGIRTVLWNMVLIGCLSILLIFTFTLKRESGVSSGEPYVAIP